MNTLLKTTFLTIILSVSPILNAQTGSGTQSMMTFKNNGHYINNYLSANGGNVNMWPTADSYDGLWKKYGPKNIRVHYQWGSGNGYCLNAYNPSQGSNVNVYTCDLSDPEQHWDIVTINGDTKQIRLKGTAFCLNAYQVSQGSNINLWTCNPGDTDQWFEREYRTVVVLPGD